MAGITLEQAQAKLDLYMAAAEAISQSKAYSIGGRSMTYQDLSEINRAIGFWDNKVKTLTQQSSGRSRSRSVAPGW